jgi:hypothetical protein
MPSSRYDVANPRIDQIGPSRRLEPDAPLVAAYLGGRPVVLARPEQRDQAYPDQETLPISVSRLRRAIDIEADRATGPFTPSLVDDFPLTHLPMVYELSGDETCTPCIDVVRQELRLAIGITLGIGAVGALAGAALSPSGDRGADAIKYGAAGSALALLFVGALAEGWFPVA